MGQKNEKVEKHCHTSQMKSVFTQCRSKNFKHYPKRRWLVIGWVLWHINRCRLFNAKSIFMKIVLFQTIQFSISMQLKCEKQFYFKIFSLVKQFYS